MSSILSIGTTGLAAANLGMATTSHNISNVNTPGYSRQQIIQRAALAGFSGSGFGGKGVEVAGIQRITDSFVTQQLQLAKADSANSDVQLDFGVQLSNLLTRDESSVSGTFNRFFSSVQDLAAHPADITLRQSVVSNTQALASRFNNLDTQLSAMGNEIGGRLGASVETINSKAAQVAKLNDAITLAMGSGQAPNDLLDQRDTLINDISKEVRVSTLGQADGQVNLFLASGDPLVLGNDAITLVVQADSKDPSRFQLASKGAATGGALRAIQNSVDLGGTAGGLLAVQDSIANARNDIGRLAMTFADAVNTQQVLGQDLNGIAGQPMFTVGAPRVTKLSGTVGDLSVTVASASALQASDYQLKYDGTNYTVTRLSDNVQTTFTTLPKLIDGMNIAAGATALVAGDALSIQPVRDGSGTIRAVITDPAKVAAALPINATPAGTNVSSTTVRSLTVDKPTPNVNLGQTVDLIFTSPTAYDITINGVATGTSGTLAADGVVALNGWTMVLNGSPKIGDTFTVAPNVNGTGDNRNLLEIAKLPDAKLVAGSTLGDANGRMVGRIGSQTAALNVTATANQSLLTQITERQQSIAGVNLDEEAANLMRYQQAYQAAAKAMATAATLFDAILAIGR